MSNIYGEVNSPQDITKINEKIRSEVRTAKSRARLSELHKRSQYLITLTYSPNFKKSLYGEISDVRNRAKKEFSKTAKVINEKAERLNVESNYDEKWG